jgi:serine/threonine protein kinase
MRDLLSGLKYLEDRQIMHRDMKPENVMIRNTKQGYRELVIVDFGLAEFVQQDRYLLEKCGTPGYVAPEVAHFKQGDRLTAKCDVFSLGVIFHLLTCRSHLFEGSSSDEVYKKNTNLDFNLFDPKYNSINPTIMDLLRKMLTTDVSHRISISEALKHPFF